MISKSGLQAIQAVTALAELPLGKFVGAADLARSIGAPPNYLGKLLQQLGKQGVVQSRKGQGGGYRLVGDPRTVSLFEVVEPIESLERWSTCFLGRHPCTPEAPCAVHERWEALRQSYLDLLRRTKVADLVSTAPRSGGSAR